MAIHFDAINAFMWTRRYAAKISILLTRMILDGRLIYMAAIMWIIIRRNNK